MHFIICLTELHVLVIGHDENDVGPDVAAVALDSATQALAPRGEGRRGRQLGQHEAQGQEPAQAHGLHGVR